MTAAVIVAEANPLTEHLALLIIAVAAAGALLLIASFAALLVSTCRDRSTRRPEPEPTKATKSSPNPFGDPD